MPDSAPREIVLPVVEVADSGLTSDGSEIPLFPEAAAKLARQKAGVDDDDLSPPGASPLVFAIPIALIAAVLGVAFARLRANRSDQGSADIPAPPSAKGEFRG